MMIVLRTHALLRAFPMVYKGGNSLDDIKMTEGCRYFFKKTRVADKHMRHDNNSRNKSSTEESNKTRRMIRLNRRELNAYSSKTPACVKYLPA